MSRWVTTVIALATTFLGGLWLGQYVSRPEIVERVRVDTVFYERPKPFAVAERPVAVHVPRMLFAPADTVDRAVVVGDSIRITVTERTLEYRDSTYYARVVGPVVGNLSPRLDFIETYNTTKTTTQIIKQPRKFLSLAAIVGTDYAKAGWSPYVEVGLSADLRFATLTATAGVDNAFKTPEPRIGIEMGIPLWSL